MCGVLLYKNINYFRLDESKKMKSLITITLLMIPNLVSGQVSTEAYSNKAEYAYGEVMEITLKVTNNSEEPLAYKGTSTYRAHLVSISEVSLFPDYTTADDYRDTLWVGESVQASWEIDPGIAGVPTVSGSVTVVASLLGQKDSVSFEAERFLGGEISVLFNEELVDTSEALSIADSLNAEIIGYSKYPSYQWRINGHQIDSLITVFENDARFVEVRDSGRDLIEAKNIIRTNKENESGVRSQFSLSQNYPNPFNPETTIEYTMQQAGQVELSLYDMMGRKIRVLDLRRVAAGTHSVRVDAADLPSGVYIYRLKSSEGVLTKKLTLIK